LLDASAARTMHPALGRSLAQPDGERAWRASPGGFMQPARRLISCLAVVSVVLFAPTQASAQGTHRAPAAAPRRASLPAGIHRTRTGRYTQDVCPHDQPFFCLAERLLPLGWKPGDALDATRFRSPQVTMDGMAPADVLAGYGIPASSAAHGAIVAIVDGADSGAFADLTAYRSNYGLPPLPKCTTPGGVPDGTTPCFAQVAQNGGPSTGGDAGGTYDLETGLDMDMISAGCPDCAILLVEFDITLASALMTAVQTAVRLGAVATSISFSGPEGQGGGNDPTGYTTPGHLVLAGAGDWGYELVDEGVMTPGYPASAPDVLAVGGTTLFNNGTSYDEAVWDDGTFSTAASGQDVTSSGCSTEFPMPTWQATALTGSGCSMRATADLAAAASFASGGQEIGIASYASGSWGPVEGTSASSPLVAGILTRLGLAVAFSNDLSFPYTHASAFNDLGSTSYPVDPAGSNTDAQITTCGILCTAGPGWDGPSGVGTPNGPKLAALGNPNMLPDAGTDAAADAATDANAGMDAAATNDAGTADSSPVQTFDSGGPTTGPSEGGTALPDSGSTSGNGDNGSSSGGCGCRVTGTPSYPRRDVSVLMLLLLGATCIRRRIASSKYPSR
jgi:hypothetical protein